MIVNKPKILVIVVDKRTLQEYIYKEVQNFELVYAESQVVEFIVTDKDLARHHFPKEQLGLTEENIKGNPMYEVIGRFKNVPPHFRPDYTHGDNSNG